MRKYVTIESMFVVTLGFIILFLMYCPSSSTNTSNDSGGGSTAVAPKMVSISTCTVNGGASSGSGTLNLNDNIECTITSDIVMSSATLYLSIREVTANEYGNSPSTNPNAKTTTIPAIVQVDPSGFFVYPKIKICSGTICNTYEYNAADEPTPYVYYLGGVPTTVTLTFY